MFGLILAKKDIKNPDPDQHYDLHCTIDSFAAAIIDAADHGDVYHGAAVIDAAAHGDVYHGAAVIDAAAHGDVYHGAAVIDAAANGCCC